MESQNRGQSQSERRTTRIIIIGNWSSLPSPLDTNEVSKEERRTGKRGESQMHSSSSAAALNETKIAKNEIKKTRKVRKCFGRRRPTEEDEEREP